MQLIYQRRSALRWVAAAWLTTHAGACGRGDVVLGEGGGPIAAMRGQTDAGTLRMQPTAAVADSGAAIAGEPPAAQKDAPVSLALADGGEVPNAPARASAGCGKPVPSMPPTGLRGNFLLDTPATYNNMRAYALVLAFRGTSLTVEQFRAQLDLTNVTADAAIVVHVDPVGGAEGWDFQRDMSSVDTLMAAVSADYCIDQDRVFAIGDGAGALFINLLGCVRADKVRAIALLASAPPPPGPCGPRIAVWLLQQSDTDPMLVSGGLGNRDYWLSRNGCDLTVLEPQSSSGCVAYANCTPEFPVRYCEHQGDALPDHALVELWDFFSTLH
jgi:polyhydroxybutyrate depolymerase